MKTAPKPANESARLRKLQELDILDTLEEQAYDDLTRLAADICQTPIALVSLIDHDRQWFKSHHGLDVRETPRDYAFCAHAILGDDLFIVEDSAKDKRFADNPLATDFPNVKFYAGAPLIMDNDIKLGTLCVISDKPYQLTPEQKHSLEALARQVVSQLELRLKIKELKLLDHAKDEFIATVSHELRTPLTSIYGSLSLLMNKVIGDLNNQQQEMINISYRNTDRLLNLVNDILDLAKLESGEFELQTEDINVEKLLTKAVELNQHFCDACHVSISTTLDDQASPESLTVHADEQRLLQVLSNLISNAAKFTVDGDIIELHAKPIDNYLRISITDHGPGIPYEEQGNLFEKFRQLHKKLNSKMPGTGLGLNISKHVIELHHGSIGFESRPDIETTFYFTLPLKP